VARPRQQQPSLLHDVAPLLTGGCGFVGLDGCSHALSRSMWKNKTLTHTQHTYIYGVSWMALCAVSGAPVMCSKQSQVLNSLNVNPKPWCVLCATEPGGQDHICGTPGCGGGRGLAPTPHRHLWVSGRRQAADPVGHTQATTRR
jgi:hypothetical protein